MSQPDILVFMSDQHSPVFSTFEGGIARTPNMEKLCEDGVNFSSAYTSCPLCVPARISMLLEKLPSETGVFSNEGAISETNPTFLHALAATGYETVLIGRMHFIGSNQRHGFTRRLVGDMTPVTWNRPAEKLTVERGVFDGCFAEPKCLNVIGGGHSPVLEYDREVIQTAVDYLSKSYDKPQCIFVSTYGPHFPYVSPVEIYLRYKDMVTIPESFRRLPEYLNPLLIKRVTAVPEDTVINARSAYFGMIETIDKQMGHIREAFDTYIERSKREGIFTYISDHGDQAGDRKMFGKQTFFESSARIPFIMAGSRIKEGLKVNTPVSIMDLGLTLCELAGAKPLSGRNGKSLVNELQGNEHNESRAVFSEMVNGFNGHNVISRMVRRDNFKYITYIGYEQYDLLFDLESDPEEMHNLAESNPDLLQELREVALRDWDYGQILQRHSEYMENVELIKKWERTSGPDDTERWNRNPEYARVRPRVV